MFPLIDAAELIAKSSEKQADLKLIDVRWYLGIKRGQDEYAAGHLPGAVFVDLDSALASAPASANGGPGRHPLPNANVFEQAMRSAGVSDDTLVVAYDDAGGSIAARLWWLLRYFGHERVAVLDGGIDAWKNNGGALSTDEPKFPRGNFTAKHVHSAHIVDRDHVSRAIQSGGLVLDARAKERYRGDAEPIDARAGHIPGARNAPWSENLSDGKFLTAGELGKKIPRARCRFRSRGHRLLRVGRHRLPRFARARARRNLRRKALRRELERLGCASRAAGGGR